MTHSYIEENWNWVELKLNWIEVYDCVSLFNTNLHLLRTDYLDTSDTHLSKMQYWFSLTISQNYIKTFTFKFCFYILRDKRPSLFTSFLFIFTTFCFLTLREGRKTQQRITSTHNDSLRGQKYRISLFFLNNYWNTFLRHKIMYKQLPGQSLFCVCIILGWE